MPTIDIKLQTHLRSYQRLLAAELDRMRTMAHLGDQTQRKAVLGRLKALRLATRDLEKVLEAEKARAEPVPVAPRAGAAAPNRAAVPGYLAQSG